MGRIVGPVLLASRAPAWRAHGGPGWARQTRTRMVRLPEGVRLLRGLAALLLCLAFGVCPRAQALAQSGASSPQPPPQDSTKQDSTKQASAPAPANGPETAIHDTPTTFKVRVNLVLVRVVVRDSEGKPVANLKKEDFLLSDNRKPQTISTFSMETAATRTVKNVNVPIASEDPTAAPPAAVSGLAQRFVTMLFDDVHLSMSDGVFVRKSAER